ncbi:MAG: hypothetical protein KME23_21305 [Goleter apudmare HA4340-LM2]|jgi:hypothetical protein|nr:hypothetical protein [Goleter apudmare HA4340-LM2]
MKRVFAVLALSCVAFSPLAVQAQSNQKFIQVGVDADTETPILLEVESIYKRRQKLYQKYGTGMKETTFHVSCAEARLWIDGAALYNSRGQLVDKSTGKTEITPITPGSIAANALGASCRGVRAQGW